MLVCLHALIARCCYYLLFIHVKSVSLSFSLCLSLSITHTHTHSISLFLSLFPSLSHASNFIAFVSSFFILILSDQGCLYPGVVQLYTSKQHVLSFARQKTSPVSLVSDDFILFLHSFFFFSLVQRDAFKSSSGSSHTCSYCFITHGFIFMFCHCITWIYVEKKRRIEYELISDVYPTCVMHGRFGFGQIIHVIDMSDEEWWRGQLLDTGIIGLFPSRLRSRAVCWCLHHSLSLSLSRHLYFISLSSLLFLWAYYDRHVLLIRFVWMEGFLFLGNKNHETGIVLF